MITTSILALAAHPLLVAFGWALVHFLWQAVLIALVTCLALVAMRRRSAAARYLVACCGMATMALAPIATTAWLNSIPRDSLAARAAAGTQYSVAAKSGMPAIVVEQKSTGSTQPNDVPTRPQNLDAYSGNWSKGIVSRELSRRFEPWLPVAVGIWALGVMGLSARMLGGLRRVRKLRRSGIKSISGECETVFQNLIARMKIRCVVRLAESSLAQVPAVIGWLRPTILVPASVISGLPTSELEALLAHELAHIRRHDYLVNLVQSVVETLLFYHPAVWWLSRTIRSERENCCDDVAVAVCGNRVAFARALAHLEELRCNDRQFVVAASGGSLLHRIRRVVGREENPPALWWPAGLLTLLCLAALTAAAGISMARGTDPTLQSAKVNELPIVDVGQEPEKSSVTASNPTNEISLDVETLATFKFDMSSRESSKWIEINGVSVPVDHSVKAEGVSVYLSLMFDVIAVDAKTDKVLWHLDWNKSMPIWETVSIVKLAQEGKEPRLAVELRQQGSVDSNLFAYHELQLGTTISVVRQIELMTPETGADENDDWGPELEGLQTRLTLLSSEDLAVGKPLKVRYEVKNVSDQEKSYDPQTVFPFRVLSATGPDGNPDSYIGGSFQTSGGPTPIKAGETQTLFDDKEVGELYLLGSAGKYKLKCRAGNDGFGDDRTVALPESNELTVELADGILNEPKGAYVRLQKLFPPEKQWEVTMRFGAIYISHHASNLKSDTITIQIWFTDEKLADDYRLGKGDQQQEINYLGQHPLGHAYVAALPRAKDLAPDYVEAVRVAIVVPQTGGQTDRSIKNDVAKELPNDDKGPQSVDSLPWAATGRVTDGVGQPVEGAEVRVHCGVGSLRLTGASVTDKDGVYSVAFGPGIMLSDKVDLQAATVTVFLAGHFEKNLCRQGDLLAALKLPDGENGWGKKPEDIFVPNKLKEINFILLPATKVHGVVLDVSGFKLDGVRVSLTGKDLPPSSSVIAQTRTDKGGRFEFTEVPIGFGFQLLIEPAKAEPPWLAWASPELYFELVKDDQQQIQIRCMGATILTKELQIELHGKGVNWRDALESALNFEQKIRDEFTKENEQRIQDGKPPLIPNLDLNIPESNRLGLILSDKAWGFRNLGQ